MSPDDLGKTLHGLDVARAQYESLSGACATLAGLVCIEAKKRLGHGHYLPWVKQHLGKTRETAAQYVAIAKEFTKCQPRLTFEQMTLALMDGAQTMSGQALDLTHPTVSAVAEWTAGRTFYELREKFARQRGGARQKGETQLSAAEQLALTIETLKEDCKALGRLLQVHTEQPKYRILTEADAEGLHALAEAFTQDLAKWLKTPKSKRPVIDAAKLL